MGELYTHSSKMPGPSLNNQKIKMKKPKKLEKGGHPIVCQTIGRGRVACWPQHRPPFLCACLLLFLPPTSIFFYMWSTPPHWLQHMPALPRLLLKFSNMHNFWSVAPKITKFVVLRSSFWDTFGGKKII